MATESLQVRPRPPRTKRLDSQRDSNLVRASVLETALQLGFGQNSTVADWIFNNPLSEEPEHPHPEPDNQVEHDDTKSDPALDGPEATTPTFTSGSNSISDESSSLNSPANSFPSAAITTIQVHADKPSINESPHVHFGDFSSDQLQLSPFALSPHDAYRDETRGTSLGSFPRDSERSHSQDDSLRSVSVRQWPSPGSTDPGYISEGQYLSKGKAKKGKDKPGKSKGGKSSKPQTPDTNETGEKDGDYTSDGGYLSASSNKSQGKTSSKVKSRAMAFFRRRPKKTGRASDDEDEESIPPVPAIPILARPSSPKPLGRRVAPASPARSGFSPLPMNLTSRPSSPPKRSVSKSPPLTRVRATSPQRADHFSTTRRSPSPRPASTSVPTVLATAAHGPPSMPGSPLSTASFPAFPSTPAQPWTGASFVPKSLASPSSRQHFSIPPPTPPPTFPLPQLPPTPYDGTLPASLASPSIPSRGIPARLVPVVPTVPGSVRPLTPRKAASPFRPILSPGAIPSGGSYIRNGGFPNGFEDDQPTGKDFGGRQRSGSALATGFGSTPAFLQRKIQHGPSASPRQPPPDVPLLSSPSLIPSTRPRTPIGPPSKFHEHFFSVSSVPLSQALSTPTSMSPSPSMATLSGSSSGPSVRSLHSSSASDRSGGAATQDSLNVLEYSPPATVESTVSETSYGHPITSTFGRPTTDINSHFSDEGDISSSTYSPMMHRDSSSMTTYDDSDADVDNVAPKSCFDEEDDDVSVYSSEGKTAGRRTMYLMEHGEGDESTDEIGTWDDHTAPPLPLPPLPSMHTRPGPGYF